MTQLIFKDDIDQSKIDILLSMIKSWNIEAEVKPSVIKPKKSGKKKVDFFANTRGIWKDRDIDDKKLREMAWGKRPGLHDE